MRRSLSRAAPNSAVSRRAPHRLSRSGSLSVLGAAANQALGISEETVQVHLKNVFGKLQVSDRTAALNVVLKRGIVQLRYLGRSKGWVTATGRIAMEPGRPAVSRTYRVKL